jgi:nucleoside-diphosphate-sugar epimerase
VLGNGRNLIPCVVIEELAAAVTRAASSDCAAGKAYNLSGANPISQRELLELHAAVAGLRVPTRSLPRSVAMFGAACVEQWYRLLGRREPPPLTRFVAWLASTDCVVDISRAATDLGWEGAGSYGDAVRRSVQWIAEQPTDSTPFMVLARRQATGTTT